MSPYCIYLSFSQQQGDSLRDKYTFACVIVLGREEGQLWYPRKVAVIRTSGKYVVCDRGSERSRMQLFTKNGQFIKKIAIRYIDIVAGLAITAQGIHDILSTCLPVILLLCMIT